MRKALGLLFLVASCSTDPSSPPAGTAPAIVSQPGDQTVTVGTSASFSVSATDATAYQWSSSTDGVSFTAVSGATAASYSTGATALAQSGTRYRVEVSNNDGEVTSSAALLTVTAAPVAGVAPTFTGQPFSETIRPGETAGFAVAALGQPSPSYQWRLGGAAFTNGALTSGACAGASVSGAATVSLSLSNVPLSCSGATFSAVASNGTAPDAISNDAVLTVTTVATAPSITQQPANVAVQQPAPASFTAAATGSPSPAVQWQQSLDGGRTWTNIAGATSPTLTLTSTLFAQSSNHFRAVFTNSAGSASSNAATLTVTLPPSIVAALGVGLDSAGNLFFTTFIGSQIFKLTQAGVLTVFAGSGATGVQDGTGTGAEFFLPEALAIDAADNLYIADLSANDIRKITPAGVVTTLAGSTPGSNDGTGSTAQFNRPQGLAVDVQGNVYVADSSNATIRKITPNGEVTTLAGSAGQTGGVDGVGAAARFFGPIGLAVDAAGNVYVSDNMTIRKIAPGGSVTTIAGTAQVDGSADGTGAAASFSVPTGLALDAAGNLYVADENNATIRKITPAGVVTTFAGLAGSKAFTDGTGSAARFVAPNSIAIDPAGNLYIADLHLIRKITPAAVVTTLAR